MWIEIKHTVNNKTVVDALLYSDVRRVSADSKLVGGKLKRTFTFTLSDGSLYEIPDEAKIINAPAEYTMLVESISKSIKV